MTISKDKRLLDMQNALVLMMDALGAQALDAVDFVSYQTPFDKVMPTTWDELESRGLVEITNRWNVNTYALTGAGWYRGLKETEKISDPDFRHQMDKLQKTLKDRSERQEDVWADAEDVARSAGVSLDFVYNAIESQLLDHERDIYGAEWDLRVGKRGSVIRIPRRFGQKRL